MKKIYLLLILITTVSICGCNNQKKNDLKEYGLKGRVKYIEEKTYSTKEKLGEIEKDTLVEYCLVSFNKDGNILNYISNFKFCYKYNLKGDKIEKKLYETDGSLYLEVIYKYNSRGDIIGENAYKLDGNLYWKNNYKYDSKGNILEKMAYKSDDSLYWKEIFKYDSKRNIIEEKTYEKGNTFPLKDTYKYDSKGDMIEKDSYINDVSLFWKYTYKYDSKGNKVEKCDYNLDGSLDMKETYEYVYDSKDNWIKKIVKDKNGGVKEITERKIVYYGDKDENNYPKWDSPSFTGINIQTKL